MNRYTLNIHLDPAYADRIAKYEIDFTSYLQGVVYEHFLERGDYDNVTERLAKGSPTAYREIKNRAGLGTTLSNNRKDNK